MTVLSILNFTNEIAELVALAKPVSNTVIPTVGKPAMDQFFRSTKVRHFAKADAPAMPFTDIYPDDPSLDRLCRAIEQANQDTEPVDTDAVLAEWDNEEIDDRAATLLANALDAVLDVYTPVPPKPTMLEQVRADLVSTNPWELNWAQYATQPAGDKAIELIFQDAIRVAEKYPQAKSALDEMVRNLETVTRAALDSAENVSGHRAADAYRAFARPLRLVIKAGYPCQRTLQELLLAPSMPWDELDNPGWIDAYTGEVDPNADQIIRFNKKTKGEEKKEAEWLSDPMAMVAIQSEEDFDQNDGLDDIFFDETDIATPMWKQIADDFRTKNLSGLKDEAKSLIDDLHQVINKAFEDQKIACEKFAEALHELPVYHEIGMGTFRLAVRASVFYPKYKLETDHLRNLSFNIYKSNKEAIQNIRNVDVQGIFRSSPEAQAYIDFLNKKIDAEESPVDIARMFLLFQHGCGFEEDDASQIRLGGNYPTLLEFIEENEDEIIGAGDSLWREEAVVQSEIDEFVDDSIDLIVDQGNSKSGNVVRTPAYLAGFFDAVMGSDSVTKEQAEAAGWEAFRAWKCPEGNVAFHKARKAGKDLKTAMGNFWYLANKAEKLAKENSIVAVSPSGLKLSSGRSIDWYIAQLKLKNNELNLSQEDRVRLKDKLTNDEKVRQTTGLGLAFVKAL